MKTLMEKSAAGRRNLYVGGFSDEEAMRIPKDAVRQELEIPELSETEVVRHYTSLSTRNYGVDTGFYPLGSCTMKYNPKVNEDVARLAGFADIHPLQDVRDCQGALRLMAELEDMLCEITGMDGFTLQPCAGAHGELTGIMIVKKYFDSIGEARGKVLVPDSSHGTNPATVGYCGYDIVVVSSDERGNVDLEDLREKMDEGVAALMLTNPNTLGLFDENICDVTDIVHSKGGLVYYDGANMNAIMGVARPGDMGYDIVHLNLHKTFSTPHGGGGPGAGPVGVKEHLRGFLPSPKLRRDRGGYVFQSPSSDSVGMMRAFWGNFAVLVRAYTYILALGGDGLRQASRQAVLNANYLKEKLKGAYDLPFDRTCMHEFVLSGRRQAHENHVSTLDVAKRLLDYSVHAPTVYFPLIVEQAMMVEPTETESRHSLDEFADIMLKIAKECETEPEIVKSAPHTTCVSRPDDTRAARNPVLTWNMHTG